MTRRAHPPQLLLDNQLCFALYRASRAVQRSYQPYLAELGLTYPQYLTMLVLWEADEPLTVGTLGERLRLDSGTLTPLLKRLEESGLVERRRDPDDERRVNVGLTRAGRALQRRAEDVPAQVFACYGLSLEEGAALHGALTRLSDQLEELAV
ncbi:MAG: MarR family transcriptional regulator [Candidatus Nanopelagicales bacterium]